MHYHSHDSRIIVRKTVYKILITIPILSHATKHICGLLYGRMHTNYTNTHIHTRIRCCLVTGIRFVFIFPACVSICLRFVGVVISSIRANNNEQCWCYIVAFLVYTERARRRFCGGMRFKLTPISWTCQL